MRVFTMLPMRHWREAGPFGAAAEAAGFDALMTVELGHDVFTPLAFAALATERIELTPSIAVAFPRSPTVMASQAWDLHANSKGRFVLGLGSQVKGHNERRFGIPWSPPAPRQCLIGSIVKTRIAVHSPLRRGSRIITAEGSRATQEV